MDEEQEQGELFGYDDCGDDYDDELPTDELSEGKKQMIRKLYEQFDVNKSKTLSPKELRKALQFAGLNPTVKEVKAIVQRYDKKKITYEIWEEIFKEELLSKTNPEFDLMEAFRIFDRDGNGTLDREELRICLTRMGEKLSDQECDELFDQLDKNGDGELNFMEASKLLA
ncbi:hypothetical protein ACF0H5_002730 [Mactra antiquata]